MWFDLKPGHHGASKNLTRYVTIALVAGVLVAALSFAYQVFVPMSREKKIIEVHVPRGTSAHRVALMLRDQGLVRSPRFLQLLVGLMGSSTRLKAGEYEFSPSMTLWEIVKLLHEGRVKLYPFLVREGATVRDIAKALERQGFGKEDRFWALTRRPYLNRRMEVPAPLDNLEGYLFPDTYYLSKDLSEFEILMMMLKNFSHKFDRAMEARAKEIGLTRHEVVTLASIIEWEAEVDRERAMISSVFHNRLRKGQNLQSCATVLYAIGRKKRLFYKDLVVQSIYNTYKHPGLPPTPINNPGKASLIAALYPEESPYFYFVSKGDKTHYFSVSGREHEGNVKKAEAARRERRQKAKKTQPAKPPS